MAYEFKLPDLGEGLTEGEIARWLVTEGQELAEDDPLVEIQTDKTTVEIPSPAAGTVAKILVGEGEVVPVGTVLVVIGGEPAVAPPAGESVVSTQARIQATPLVRRVAQELGVDLAQLSGSGPNGRITEEDVRRAAGGEIVLEQHKPSAAAEGRRERLRGVRRQIVEHLTKAQQVPAVTFAEECDFTDTDVNLLVPLALQAAAGALREFPELNARLEGDEIVYLDRYDIGVAVVRRCTVSSSRSCAAATRRPRRARGRGRPPGRRRPRRHAEAGGAARRHLHDHERRQARWTVRDPAPQLSRGRHPRLAPDRPAPRRP